MKQARSLTCISPEGDENSISPTINDVQGGISRICDASPDGIKCQHPGIHMYTVNALRWQGYPAQEKWLCAECSQSLQRMYLNQYTLAELEAFIKQVQDGGEAA